MEFSDSVLADISNHFASTPSAAILTTRAASPTDFGDLSHALSLLKSPSPVKHMDPTPSPATSISRPTPSISPTFHTPAQHLHQTRTPVAHISPSHTVTQLSAELASPASTSNTRHLASLTTATLTSNQELSHLTTSLQTELQTTKHKATAAIHDLTTQNRIYARNLSSFQSENVRLTDALNALTQTHNDLQHQHAKAIERTTDLTARVEEDKFVERHEAARIKTALEGMAEETVKMRTIAEEYRQKYEQVRRSHTCEQRSSSTRTRERALARRQGVHKERANAQRAAQNAQRVTQNALFAYQ